MLQKHRNMAQPHNGESRWHNHASHDQHERIYRHGTVSQRGVSTATQFSFTSPFELGSSIPKKGHLPSLRLPFTVAVIRFCPGRARRTAVGWHTCGDSSVVTTRKGGNVEAQPAMPGWHGVLRARSNSASTRRKVDGTMPSAWVQDKTPSLAGQNTVARSGHLGIHAIHVPNRATTRSRLTSLRCLCVWLLPPSRLRQHGQ